MMTKGVPAEVPDSVVTSGAYRILETLGAGGMATVHRAYDTVRGAEVALKRLRTDVEPEAHRRGIAHLEREFHTLSQLAHPRVVQVFDYRVDCGEPYYTMELLDGGDLQERSPLEWRTACAVAIDICSALSLMHSRRLVHRDLSPRNVRCTSDGRAKLIDFGAMVAMGPCKSVVGTPAICAPELVRLQSLDGRTDLFALGATLYYTLTGRFPYPARSFAQLESMWKQRPPAPSDIVPGISAAVDALVMDLLQLDAALRPSNASEVMQRLRAAAGLSIDEQLLVSQAYLATPNLVGRDAAVARMRKYTSALCNGRGRAVLVDGQAGVGRTRFLDACVLEGKLAGAAVIRADPSDSLSGEFGVARALGRRLLETAETQAVDSAKAHWDVLSDAIPELQALQPTRLPLAAAANQSESEREAALQRALRGWFLAFSQLRPLLLVVDDLQRVDEASAALIALLAKECRHNRLLVATSMPSGSHASSISRRMFVDASRKIELSALTLGETELLLHSVFGNVPNMQLLTAKLHAVCEGRPRDLMQLAQHLVDKGLVRYHDGTWSLPAKLDTGSLPTSLANALSERVMALGAEARQLAQAMALSDGQHVTLVECGLLADQSDLLQLRRLLDELRLAGIITGSGDQFGIGAQGFASALLGTLEPEQEPRLHARLAEVFERRGNEGILCALHLFKAGQDERGLDALIGHAEASQRVTEADPSAFIKMINSLPPGWLSVFDRALELAVASGRPARQCFLLQRRVLGLATYDSSSRPSRYHYLAPIAELSRSCGLDVYAQLDPALEPKQRLQLALADATRRYESLPDSERVLAPIDAAAQLARAVLTCVGAASSSLDLDLLRLLPSLAPLAPLSPGIAIVQQVVEAVTQRIAGRTDQARGMYQALLEQLAQLDEASLGRTYRITTEKGIYFVMANLDAALGLDSCIEWIQGIAQNALHEINACHARGLHHLWRADPLNADRERAQAELLMVQRVRRSQLEGIHLLRELPAHAVCDDLTRLQQASDNIESLASVFPNWQPVLHYARGEHARIRGDLRVALQEIETVLTVVSAGEHQIWSYAAGAQVQTLCMLQRYAAARSCGEMHLAAAERAGLGFERNHVRLPLALALARCGKFAEAQRHANDALAECRALRSKGLNLALVYETHTWIALLEGDAERTETNLAELGRQLQGCSSQTLAARHERIRRAADKIVGGGAEPIMDDRSSQLGMQIMAALTACDSTEERAQRSLDFLLAETGSTQGFLFAVTHTGYTLAASRADHELPPEIDVIARRSLAREDADNHATGELEPDSTTNSGYLMQGGRCYRSILLGHAGDGGFVVTGLGVVVSDPDAPVKSTSRIATQLSRYGSFWRDSPRLSVMPTASAPPP
jgi:hypothetical protein